jgi:hypothetical protein
MKTCERVESKRSKSLQNASNNFTISNYIGNRRNFMALDLSKPLSADDGLTLNFGNVSHSPFEDQHSNDVRNVEYIAVLSKRSSQQNRMFLLRLTCLLYVPPALTFKNSVFCPHCIYVFCVDLRTNSDYFSIQH